MKNLKKTLENYTKVGFEAFSSIKCKICEVMYKSHPWAQNEKYEAFKKVQIYKKFKILSKITRFG